MQFTLDAFLTIILVFALGVIAAVLAYKGFDK
jgi:hypothetical protein